MDDFIFLLSIDIPRYTRYHVLSMKNHVIFPDIPFTGRIRIYRIRFSFGATERLLAEKIVCGYFHFGSKTDEAQSRTS